MPFLRRGFLRSANRPNDLYGRIDPSPIAAMFFVFLYLFMSPAMVVDGQRRVSVDMASTLHACEFPAALREDAIIISLTRDGTLYFGSAKISADDLQYQIRDAIANRAYGVIFLKADARAKYGDVKAVAGLVSASGFEHVVLLVESARPPAQ